MLRAACRSLLLGEPVSGRHLARAALASYYLLCREREGGSNVCGVVLEWRQGKGENDTKMGKLMEAVPWRQLAAALEARWQEVEPLLPIVTPFPIFPPPLSSSRDIGT